MFLTTATHFRRETDPRARAKSLSHRHRAALNHRCSKAGDDAIGSLNVNTPKVWLTAARSNEFRGPSIRKLEYHELSAPSLPALQNSAYRPALQSIRHLRRIFRLQKPVIPSSMRWSKMLYIVTTCLNPGPIPPLVVPGRSGQSPRSRLLPITRYGVREATGGRGSAET